MFKKTISGNFLAKIAILLVLPLITLATAEYVRHESGPFWVSAGDPEYVYLYNSLNILNLRPPQHINHPGTPLQMLGAAVFKARHPWTPRHEITSLVLQNPEYYLRLINLTLILLTTAALAAAGMIFYSVSREIFPSLLVQASPLMSSVMVYTLPRVIAEPLLLFASTVLICLMAAALKHDEEKRDSNFYLICVGLVCAFGIATKFNFLPIIFVPLIAFSRLKSRIIYMFSVIAGALIFMAPALARFEGLAIWVYLLFMGSGIHGGGPRTVIDPEKYFSDLSGLIFSQPFPLIALVAGGIVYLSVFLMARHSGGAKGAFARRLLLGLIVAQVAQYIIVAKHPNAYYLMPSLALPGFTLAVAFLCVSQAWGGVKWLRGLLAGSALVVLVAAGYQQWLDTGRITDRYKERMTEVIALRETIAERFQDCTKVYYYPSPSKSYALHFGKNFARRKEYGEILDNVYGGDIYFYNMGNKTFYTWKEPVSWEDIQSKASCIILVGPPFEGRYAGYHPGIPFDDRCLGNGQEVKAVIYTIGRKCDQ